MAVKGSKFRPMRVIPHSPLSSALRIGLLVLAFGVSLPASYYFGIYQITEQQRQEESGQGSQHQQQLAALTQELTKLRTGADIDRQTIEELRQLVMTQKAQIMASERDLRVYKDLLSPSVKTNPLGISVGVFTAFPLKEKGHYSYSLTIQKLSTRVADFTGSLEFRIIGQQAGKDLQLSLYQVSSQVTVPSIPLDFKYFQTFDGDMALPLDFVPQTVEVVVKADQKGPTIVEIQLDWPVTNPSKIK